MTIKKMIIVLCFLLLFVSCKPKEKVVEEEKTTQSTIEKTTTTVKEESKSTSKEEKTTKKEEITTTKQQEISVYDDSLIDEYISKKGSYTDSYGEKYEYDYKVPRVKHDTEDAKRINSDIEKDIENKIKDVIENKSSGEINYTSVSWKSYWNGSVLSLVVNKKYIGGEVEDNLVFNYDFANGKRFSKKELLEHIGMSEEDFIRRGKEQVVKQIDNYYVAVNEDWAREEKAIKEFYSSVMPIRALNISKVKLSDEKLKLYVDNGKLMMYCDSYYKEKPFAFNDLYAIPSADEKPVDKEFKFEFITAKLKDNKVTLVFEDNKDYSENIKSVLFNGINKSSFDFSKQYEVKGLYSQYKDLFLATMGTQNMPYLFLVTNRNTVEVVDIARAMSYDTLCGFPIVGISDVKRLYSAEGTNGNSVFAENNAGNSYDLYKWIDMSRNTVIDIAAYEKGIRSEEVKHVVGNGGEYYSAYNLKFKDGKLNCADVSLDVGVEINGKGWYEFIGMNEDGLCYAYNFRYEDSGEEQIGSLVMRYDVEEVESLNEVVIAAKVLSGSEIFDSPNKWIIFDMNVE